MKPFRAVLKEWELAAGKVFGTCVADTRWDGLPGGEYHPGHRVMTSSVVLISPIQGSTARRCETLNSIYILV